MRIHPNHEALESFLAGLSSEPRAILHHVLSCERCRSATRGILEILRSERPRSGRVLAWRASRASYSSAFSRLPSQIRKHLWAYRQERETAASLLSELLRRKPGRRGELVASDGRYQNLALCQLLLSESRRASLESPLEGEDLARLALEVAQRLDPGHYGPRVIQDLLGRAWCEIGNARRLGSDLTGAEVAFNQAKVLVRTAEDRLEEARFADLLAALRNDQRRFPESLELQNRAIALYRRFQQPHLLGWALNNKASTFLEMGEPAQAISVLQEALPLIAPDREPRLLLSARHNLALALAEREEFDQARAALLEIRELYGQFPELLNRRRWLEGIIAAGLGRLSDAEKALTAARAGFLEQGIAYDVALVSLDLAAVYARQGRTAEVKRVALESAPLFASRELHREALAALAFFRQAAERQALSAETAHKIAGFLKRARGNPGLRFEKP